VQLVSLIRHGQAGSRTDYDRLSDLGRRQAQMLGEWLVRQRVQFDAVVVGGLNRQRETADIALKILTQAGMTPAEILHEPGWSEFDIDAVFASIAPRLAKTDESFRAAYEQLLRDVEGGDGRVHREWTDADTAVVKSWIAGEFETGCESWQQFTARVRAALDGLPDRSRVGVFTSATPVGICVARCFDSCSAHRIMNLAGAALNTNVTSLVRRNGDWLLGGFNLVAHLDEAALRTHR
jgi:broad specificity phosphatase PhoE